MIPAMPPGQTLSLDREVKIGRHLLRLPNEQSDLCWRCGYDRHGIPSKSKCPECGAEPETNVGIAAFNSERFWAISIGLGLLLLCLASLEALKHTLSLHLNLLTLSAVNVPAPRLWLAALMKRSVGDRVEEPGVLGTIAALQCCFAIVLLTIPRPRVGQIESVFSTRRMLRWYCIFATGAVYGVMVGGWVMEFDAMGSYQSALLVCGMELPASFLIYRHLFDLAGTRTMRTREALWLSSIFVPAAGAVAAGLILYAAMDAKTLGTTQAPVTCALVGALCAIAGAMATAGVIGFTVQWWLDLLVPLLSRAKWPLAAIMRTSATFTRLGVPVGILLWLTFNTYLSTYMMLWDHRQGLFGSLPFDAYVGPQVYFNWFNLSYGYWEAMNGVANWAVVLEIAAILLITAPVSDHEGAGRRVLRWVLIGMMGLSMSGIQSQFSGTPVASESMLKGIVILALNVPATLLVYLRIASVLRQMNAPGEARRLTLIAAAVTLLMALPILALALQPHAASARAGWKVMAINAPFGALALCVSVMATLQLLHSAILIVRSLVAATYHVGNDPADAHPRVERVA